MGFIPYLYIYGMNLIYIWLIYTRNGIHSVFIYLRNESYIYLANIYKKWDSFRNYIFTE